MIKEFEEVRQWGEIRGLTESSFHPKLQRVFQEVVEIHDAHTNNDRDEIIDGIGDAIVTLINLAVVEGIQAEECLEKALNVIKLRKGLTKNGQFIRYAKLSDEERLICDQKQGSAGEQYFDESLLNTLTPTDFTS